MKYLSTEDILLIHFQLTEDYGGSHGVRDERSLFSVIAAPQQSVFGQEQYNGVFEKAAVYARIIISDHLFVDGNKRTGITCAALFMMQNGHLLNAMPKELEDFAVHIAFSKADIPEIAAWFESHTTSR